MVCVGIVACLAGIGGYFAAKAGSVWLVEPLGSQVPPDKHVAFAHGAAYAGAVVVWIGVWKRRGSLGRHL